MAITQDSISRNFSQEALRVLGQGAKGERGDKGDPGADEVAPFVVSTGYTSGGITLFTSRNTIDSFPFSTPFTTASDVGDLSVTRYLPAGQSSISDGYTSGGQAPVDRTRIDSFPFSTPFTTAGDVGDVLESPQGSAGQSSRITGYNSGGRRFSDSVRTTTIQSFPFSSPFTTASDIGDLSQGRYVVAGQSSSSDGYSSGGEGPPSAIATIDSFPFSTPFTTATDVGDLSQGRRGVAGQSSSSDGYTVGGRTPAASPTVVNTIDSFPFSTPFTTAADVGDLSQGRYRAAGQSSSTDGFTSGGAPPNILTIDQFPFSAPFTTATDAGDLSQARSDAAGQQG